MEFIVGLCVVVWFVLGMIGTHLGLASDILPNPEDVWLAFLGPIVLILVVVFIVIEEVTP